MNCLMAGMLLVSKFWMPEVEGAGSPLGGAFWFIMSIALLVGFLCAYPMNWWLVMNHLKHGMMTVRANPHAMHAMKKMEGEGDMSGMAGMDHGGDSEGDDMAGMEHPRDEKPGSGVIFGVGAFSVVILAIALAVVFTLAPAH